jgi:hypothetical protein
MSDQDQDSGFKVKDRRRFDADGELREEAAAEEASAGEQQATADDGDGTDAREHRDLPAIDFQTFVLSLSTSALVHLGETPGPDGEKHKELALAKQSIDILGLLKEKTSGNLTEDEQKLLDGLLYDLRMRYVTALG